MAGVLAGLDMSEALASIPERCDRDFARELFVIAEAEYVAAALAREQESAEQQQKQNERDGDG